MTTKRKATQKAVKGTAIVKVEPKMEKWTKFMDMRSGGSQKTPYSHIFIRGNEAEARKVFAKLFPDEDPDNVTCGCCGEDFSVSESDSLDQATGYERECRYAYFDKDGNEITRDKAWKLGVGLIDGATGQYVDGSWVETFTFSEGSYPKRGIPVSEYAKSKDVLIVYGDGLTNHEPKKNPKDFKRPYPKSPLAEAFGI